MTMTTLALLIGLFVARRWSFARERFALARSSVR
jgi:hypothetical protein